MLNDLLTTIPQTGRVERIGLAQRSGAPIESVPQVECEVGQGLQGDHHSKSRPGGKRQVTLIQAEHLPVVAALCGKESVSPDLLRRNIVVSGINLVSLKKFRFRIGGALLEGTGECAPCSLMETNLGPGGYQAMRGHGGITARVLQGGMIRVGDPVVAVEPVANPDEADADE